MPRAAAIYCRLSYAPDGSLEKVERQEDDSRVIADRLGWPVCCVFSDNNKSAWQPNRKRKDWDAMLRTLEPDAPHTHDGVIVYHGDRLIRLPWDLEILLKIADDRHIPLASTTGVRDLSNEDDRFILRIEAAQACKASADTSRRVRRGWKARAQQGRPITGGKRPFGWGIETGRTGKTGKPVYDTEQPVPEEQAVLEEAIQRLWAGQSQNGVIRWMNTVSTTTGGRPWAGKSLKNILLSPRIAGLVEHDGQLYKASWDGIVTPEEWEDLKLLLLRNVEANPYPGRERKYLLSGQGGAGECSGCSMSLRTKPTSGRGRRKVVQVYYCPNKACPRPVTRSVEHLDAYVVGRTLRRLQDLELIDQVMGPAPGVAAEIVALQRRKAETKEKLRNLADYPSLDAADVAASIASFDKKIAELRNKHAASARQRLLVRMAGITPEQWDATPIDVQAETVRALYRVVILPVGRGPGFDPKSVDMVPLPLSPEQAGVDVGERVESDVERDPSARA